ncbi:MAG: DUF2173 family protein [Candidatus Competibacteraceae bacterium]|nr:DUF2173 family protein [Candidatus Competibacteraceae bacterium]
MGMIAELLAKPGVVVAGEYAYRGDRFSYRGELSERNARMASIMCRATTMGTTMEGEMLGEFCPDCGILPVRGWVMRGSGYTICVVANVFCLLDNRQGSLNQILGFMRQALADDPMDLI